MKKTIGDLRDKSLEALQNEVAQMGEELAKLQLERGVNPTKDSNLIPKKKKRLAVALTIISEKKKLQTLGTK
ncbi:50S ribosomal protein L29 [Candidatus Roizmanbacteria bacterium CG09_land_8_20_14_0_10_41_9]|uniref:Large ribosomal subunit protein uL29 n=1 Tax=Candidatus Roizmanbacteria bacterium CG09_land_8_20_14_0_10_41_9 TaxID=1974850 RepID=A0A2H0WV20_9BACT|nr:MAG: 50S ribosomal protein L29 [Candidatus Roizmanbacteria bacterium CG09_land_8_20_14_0_10_41_9]